MMMVCVLLIVIMSISANMVVVVVVVPFHITTRVCLSVSELKAPKPQTGKP